MKNQNVIPFPDRKKYINDINIKATELVFGNTKNDSPELEKRIEDIIQKIQYYLPKKKKFFPCYLKSLVIESQSYDLNKIFINVLKNAGELIVLLDKI